VTKNDIVTTVKSYIGRPVSVLREKTLHLPNPLFPHIEKKTNKKGFQ